MIIWIFLCTCLALSGTNSVEDSSEFGLKSVVGTRTTNCTCGISNKGLDKRIIKGKEAIPHEFPFIAALVSPRTMFVFCGGAIISDKHILTAAHCTVAKEGQKFAAALGAHDVSKKNSGIVVIGVEKTIEHSEYTRLAHHNDIAIAVLESKIQFGENIVRACLPTEPIPSAVNYVRVIGWGRTTPEGYGSDILMKVDLNIVPLEDCAKTYPIRTHLRRQFCTYKNGHDSCKGDSGGPLVFLDKETNRYTLAGLVSYGKSCAGKAAGVNTHVFSYIDWISSMIGDSATCSKV